MCHAAHIVAAVHGTVRIGGTARLVMTVNRALRARGATGLHVGHPGSCAERSIEESHGNQAERCKKRAPAVLVLNSHLRPKLLKSYAESRSYYTRLAKIPLVFPHEERISNWWIVILTWSPLRRRLEVWLTRTEFTFGSILGRTKKKLSRRGTNSKAGGKLSVWISVSSTKWTAPGMLRGRLRRNQPLKKLLLGPQKRKKSPQ